MTKLALWLAFILLMIGCSSNTTDIVKGATLDLDKSITVGNALDRYKYFSYTRWSIIKDEQGRTIVDFIGNLDIDKLLNTSNDAIYHTPSTKIVVGHLEAHIQFIVNADRKGFKLGSESIIDNGVESPAQRVIDTIYGNNCGTFCYTVYHKVQHGRQQLMKDLWTAIDKNDLPAVKEFIANGFDVNTKFDDGYTLLTVVAVTGSPEVVQAILDKGADPNVKDKSGWTALMLAASRGELEIVKALIDKGADVNAKDNDDWTVLMVACRKDKLEIVKALIDKGADVNAKDNKGETALMVASVLPAHEKVKELLIRAGAK